MAPRKLKNDGCPLAGIKRLAVEASRKQRYSFYAVSAVRHLGGQTGSTISDIVRFIKDLTGETNKGRELTIKVRKATDRCVQAGQLTRHGFRYRLTSGSAASSCDDSEEEGSRDEGGSEGEASSVDSEVPRGRKLGRPRTRAEVKREQVKRARRWDDEDKGKRRLIQRKVGTGKRVGFSKQRQAKAKRARSEDDDSDEEEDTGKRRRLIQRKVKTGKRVGFLKHRAGRHARNGDDSDEEEDTGKRRKVIQRKGIKGKRVAFLKHRAARRARSEDDDSDEEEDTGKRRKVIQRKVTKGKRVGFLKHRAARRARSADNSDEEDKGNRKVTPGKKVGVPKRLLPSRCRRSPRFPGPKRDAGKTGAQKLFKVEVKIEVESDEDVASEPRWSYEEATGDENMRKQVVVKTERSDVGARKQDGESDQDGGRDEGKLQVKVKVEKDDEEDNIPDLYS